LKDTVRAAEDGLDRARNEGAGLTASYQVSNGTGDSRGAAGLCRPDSPLDRGQGGLRKAPVRVGPFYYGARENSALVPGAIAFTPVRIPGSEKPEGLLRGWLSDRRGRTGRDGEQAIGKQAIGQEAPGQEAVTFRVKL
jgi:hypothetical protein